MNTKSPYALAAACLLSLGIALPTDIFAVPQEGVQRAGEVSKVIPTVNIARGSKTLPADAKTVVDWNDVVNTQSSARARVALDDGSVLNVGSDSSVTVVKHDSGAQQTDLEVGFGKMRSQAQKISKPGGKFEVHTAAGVAGVVGTDFFVSFENNIMTVIVFEGVVKTCNLAGVCAAVKAGQITTIRNGDNSAPSEPAQASSSLVTEAVTATNLQGPPKTVEVRHISKATWLTIAVLAAVPAIVVPIVVTRGSTSPPAGSQPACIPNADPVNCTKMPTFRRF
jgi:FecR protein